LTSNAKSKEKGFSSHGQMPISSMMIITYFLTTQAKLLVLNLRILR